jgi:glyoxylase-like metal-dependent hydrolase (beta-lactamase superfamily II)
VRAAEPAKPAYEVLKHSDTLYEFRAKDLGYIVKAMASIGPDGVLLVETGTRQNLPELRDSIKRLGGGEPRFVINSHSHGEHWDGNIALGKGPVYIGHPNYRKALRSNTFLFQELDQAILPQVTVEEGLSLHFNEEEIRIKAFPGAHDNSDLVIWFTKSKVAFVGALVTTLKIPTVDGLKGDIRRYPEVTRKVLEYLPEDVKLVPGHGENATHGQGEQFLGMLEQTAAKVREGIAQGKSLETMNKEDLLKEWAGWETSYSNRAYWLSALYQGFSGQADARKAKPGIFEPMHRALKEKGPAGVAPAYLELKRGFPDTFRFEDRDLWGITATLEDEGRFREAIAFAELLLQEFPKSRFIPRVHALLGSCHQKLGDPQKALFHFRKALELNPNDEGAKRAIESLEAPPAAPAAK